MEPFLRKISTLFAKVRFDTDLCLDIVPKVCYTITIPIFIGGVYYGTTVDI